MKLFKRVLLILPPLLLWGALSLVGQKRLDAVLLHVAAEPKPGEIASLLRRGADPKITERNGITPLHEAALAGGNTNGGLDNSTTIQVLVKHGADVNASSDDGSRPLHYAIMAQNPISVRTLLQCGARTNVKSKRFGTPLRQAKIALAQDKRNRSEWKIQSSEIIRLLRAAGANE